MMESLRRVEAASVASPIRIDIVSDVVCPWCVIGYKQLERALILSDLVAEIHWHPFELNPDMGAAGENLRDHLAAKYGTSVEESQDARARLTQLGEALGFTFDYRDDMRLVNTFRAHQLLHWAERESRGQALKMALFAAYFTERRNLDDPDVLIDVAAGVGLDRNEAAAVLAEGRYAEAVREREGFWVSRGITGVPAIIFNQRRLATGAQGVDRYFRILDRLAKEQAT